MASSIHFKFKSAKDFDTICFHGMGVRLAELKRLIVEKRQMNKGLDFDLQVTNANTSEVYRDEELLISKNTSVIVKRIPVNKNGLLSRMLNQESKPPQKFSLRDSPLPAPIVVPAKPRPLDLTVQTDKGNGVQAKGQEVLSTREPDQLGSVLRPSPPLVSVPRPPLPTLQPSPSSVGIAYICHKCGKTGHSSASCPTRVSTIPLATEVHHKAISEGESHKPPAHVHHDKRTAWDGKGVRKTDERSASLKSEQTSEQAPSVVLPKVEHIPVHLKCPVCNTLISEAALLPCCAKSACDKCLRKKLVETPVCPLCSTEDISPDKILKNLALQAAVAEYLVRSHEQGLPVKDSAQDTSGPELSSDTAVKVLMQKGVDAFLPLAEAEAEVEPETKTEGESLQLKTEAESGNDRAQDIGPANIPEDLTEKESALCAEKTPEDIADKVVTELPITEAVSEIVETIPISSDDIMEAHISIEPVEKQDEVEIDSKPVDKQSDTSPGFIACLDNQAPEASASLSLSGEKTTATEFSYDEQERGNPVEESGANQSKEIVQPDLKLNVTQDGSEAETPSQTNSDEAGGVFPTNFRDRGPPVPLIGPPSGPSFFGFPRPLIPPGPSFSIPGPLPPNPFGMPPFGRPPIHHAAGSIPHGIMSRQEFEEMRALERRKQLQSKINQRTDEESRDPNGTPKVDSQPTSKNESQINSELLELGRTSIHHSQPLRRSCSPDWSDPFPPHTARSRSQERFLSRRSLSPDWLDPPFSRRIIPSRSRERSWSPPYEPDRYTRPRRSFEINRDDRSFYHDQPRRSHPDEHRREKLPYRKVEYISHEHLREHHSEYFENKYGPSFKRKLHSSEDPSRQYDRIHRPKSERKRNYSDEREYTLTNRIEGSRIQRESKSTKKKRPKSADSYAEKKSLEQLQTKEKTHKDTKERRKGKSNELAYHQQKALDSRIEVKIVSTIAIQGKEGPVSHRDPSEEKKILKESQIPSLKMTEIQCDRIPQEDVAEQSDRNNNELFQVAKFIPESPPPVVRTDEEIKPAPVNECIPEANVKPQAFVEPENKKSPSASKRMHENHQLKNESTGSEERASSLERPKKQKPEKISGIEKNVSVEEQFGSVKEPHHYRYRDGFEDERFSDSEQIPIKDSKYDKKKRTSKRSRSKEVLKGIHRSLTSSTPLSSRKHRKERKESACYRTELESSSRHKSKKVHKGKRDKKVKKLKKHRKKEKQKESSQKYRFKDSSKTVESHSDDHSEGWESPPKVLSDDDGDRWQMVQTLDQPQIKFVYELDSKYVSKKQKKKRSKLAA